MNASKKTKAELLLELEKKKKELLALKQKITHLKKEGKKSLLQNKTPRPPRMKKNLDIEFLADFGILEAKGLNLSEGGICFELSHPIPFRMRFPFEGQIKRHKAHLVWAKQLSTGGIRIGFKFTSGNKGLKKGSGFFLPNK